MVDLARPRSQKVIWRPQPRQAVMLSRGEDEVFVGGSAGGGKSETEVIAPLRQVEIPHFRGLILRKTYKELEELLGKAERYYPKAFPRARFNGSKYTWTFPSGAKIEFGNLEHTKDKYKYQGRAFDFIGFDELTHFLFEEYVYLGSRNRPNGPGTRVYRMSSGNPGGIGHGWVKDRFVTAAKPETTIWEKVEIVHPDGFIEVQWLSRVFVPSSLFDNQELMRNDPKYAARLAAMPEKERNALLYGDWDSFAGMFFEDFRTTPDLRMAAAKGLQMSEKQLQKERRFVHVIDPFEIPNDWKIFRSFDWGSNKPFSVGWWAMDYDGVAYRILEMYGCTDEPNTGLHWTAERVAQEIRKVEQEHRWLRGKRIQAVADTAIWIEDGGPSIAERMMSQGVYFQKADKQRLPGWDQVHSRLAFDDNGFPMMYVFSNCKAFIRTIPTLQYDDVKVEDLDTEGEDHVADEVRYFCMMRPIKPRKATPPSEYYKSPLKIFLDIDEEDLSPRRARPRMEIIDGE